MIHRLRLATGGRIPTVIKEGYLRLRQLNAGGRAIPDFLILGAQKAGTTSLFNYLCMHPQVVGSIPKEIFYFCSHQEKTERWYRRHFPKSVTMASRGLIAGEATPISLYFSHAAQRASALVPDAKCIAILREPAARAVSHYYHQFRAGRELRPIDEVFSLENINRWVQGESPDLPNRFYFEWSDYATGLKHWLAHYTRKQILILEAEGMFADPQATVDQVCDFLAIEPYTLREAHAYNAGDPTAVKPKAFKALQDAFSGQKAQLEHLGLSMSWM